MVETRLNLDDCRQLEPEDLVHATLHLTGYFGRRTTFFDFDAHHQPGVRPTQNAGDDRAGRAVPVIVRLRTGQHKVESFALDGRRQGLGGGMGVTAGKRRVIQMDRPLGAQS